MLNSLQYFIFISIFILRVSFFNRNSNVKVCAYKNNQLFLQIKDSMTMKQVIGDNDIELFGTADQRVIYGDALKALRQIPDESVDLIFVDPPYNIGKDFAGRKDKWASDEEYLEWCYQWIYLCVQKLKPTGSMYLMTSTQFMPYFDLYVRDKMTILSRIVWTYDSSGVQARKFYGSLYEPILFCVKDKNHYTFNADDILVEAKTGSQRKLMDYRRTPPQPYKNEKVPGNVWNFNRVRYRMDEYENHPTQKPISLMDRIIRASSNVNDLVLDPFSGSFTTCFVAQQCHRRFIGIEIQEDYIKIGLRRLGLAQEFHGEKIVRELKSYQSKNIDMGPTLFSHANL
jgi:site-specific DNA-methyltransferase (adenine-specific)